jgi:hypothetical protein
MKRKICVGLVLVFLTVVFAAAADKPGGFQFGFSFEPFFPQGEFHDIIESIGWGGSLDAFYRIPNSDLLVGTILAYHVYGVDTRWEPFNAYVPDVWVKVNTVNAVASGHLVFRLQPAIGAAEPYIEALAGIHHLRTDTRVHSDDYDDGWIASSNQLSSTVFSYGAGGGVMLSLLRVISEEGRSRFALMLDIGIRYLRGEYADYLTPGDIEIHGDTVYRYVNSSRTDILVPRIGITFAF